ncbi:MAG: glycosyltransferase [Betaproteobacteria bacterium]|nr:glycosyltransferase [Betaproteobacteria bacterium]
MTLPRIRAVLSAGALALVVAALNLGAWIALNRPAEPVGWEGRIKGFAFNGFQRDHSPVDKRYPSAEELSADLHRLAQYTPRIRTYASAELDILPALAGDESLKVYAGAWLDGQPDRDEAEMQALMRSVRGNKNIEAAIVGNESVLRGDLTVAGLVAQLKRVRGRMGVPVSTAEPWHVWQRHPELVKNVDFITVHLLPYWEGVPVEAGVDYVYERVRELKQAFPGKRIVVGEVGWPSNGDRRKLAVASTENAARFMREFLDRTSAEPLDYFLMEAFDQPWKISEEGRAGGYWGMFDAARQPKYPLEGPVFSDARWREKALTASALALAPVFLFSLSFRRFRLGGKLFFGALTQAGASALVWLGGVPAAFYLRPMDWTMMGVLTPAFVGMLAILLVNGFEFVEVLWRRGWRREFHAVPLSPGAVRPFVSIHLPAHNEPPEMVNLTLDSLARLDYDHFEVLVIDNNTRDEAVWRPVEAHAARLGARFRFFHLDHWPGFKAGALNFALDQADRRTEIVGVVDADYVVRPNWLRDLAAHFEQPNVAVVQAPQAHRDFKHSAFQRMCNWEFDGFFRIGMHHRNERNAIIQHGTMTLVRRSALVETGKWSEWCICEDAELGLRLMNAGYETRYVDAVLGSGLTPADFEAFKAQRFRWAFGAMQILRRRWGWLTRFGPLSLGQRFHFLTGWFSWFADALHLVFVGASLAWTAGMLLNPRDFTLPLDLFVLPVLGFFLAKASFGPLLYAVRVRCGWQDTLGAALASLALSHAIALGVFRGLTAKKGVFVRTAKGTRDGSLLNAFDAVRQETMLFAALVLAAVATLQAMKIEVREAQFWAAILMAQALPYCAAMVAALISARSAAAARQPARVPAPALRPRPAGMAAGARMPLAAGTLARAAGGAATGGPSGPAGRRR